MDGRVHNQSEAKGDTEDTDHEQQEFIGDHLADILAWPAFLSHLQLHSYSTLAQLTLHAAFIVSVLDIPYYLDFQPLLDAILMHISH